jgi:hypothetical protein
MKKVPSRPFSYLHMGRSNQGLRPGLCWFCVSNGKFSNSTGTSSGRSRSMRLKIAGELAILLVPPVFALAIQKRPITSAPSVWKSCSARVLQRRTPYSCGSAPVSRTCPIRSPSVFCEIARPMWRPSPQSLRGAGVRIDVEVGKVARGDVEADAVAALEQVRGRKGLDRHLGGFRPREHLRMLPGIAIARAQDSVGEVHGEPFGIVAFGG